MSGFLLLLSHSNVKAVQRNHPDEFLGALRDIEALKTRTGLPYTTDEERRLAALAILVSKGVVQETLPAPLVKRKSRKHKEVQPA